MNYVQTARESIYTTNDENKASNMDHGRNPEKIFDSILVIKSNTTHKTSTNHNSSICRANSNHCMRGSRIFYCLANDDGPLYKPQYPLKS